MRGKHNTSIPRFYLIGSDRELLARFSDAMKKSGYLVVSEGEREAYYLDARKNIFFAQKAIKDILEFNYPDFLKGNEQPLEDQESQRLFFLNFLKNLGFQEDLLGTKYLAEMLLVCKKDPRDLKPLSKTLYPYIARQFQSKNLQVDRVISYALKTAGYEGSVFSVFLQLWLYFQKHKMKADRVKEFPKPFLQQKTISSQEFPLVA